MKQTPKENLHKEQEKAKEQLHKDLDKALFNYASMLEKVKEIDVSNFISDAVGILEMKKHFLLRATTRTMEESRLMEDLKKTRNPFAN